ncbi:ABC transporter substrate-binding protein [Hydrogenophaga crocea]|uniref:ABC transporter substrate-binding protein n=1 Tax=Hydrogenophaga crocea TaxID=2716225 RepID=A0A6G8IGR1_9BURK|nr:helical backbone metal receptor [Hydrogenophaga crocea]QIM52309.1 ABC transporter substrate-binding protein [Hydrogenophaga crocea]
MNPIRLFFALALGLCSALHAAEIRITDDRGVAVTLAQAPQRIVSLLPSLTETVCELGQCHRLVGVDRYSNFPAAVRALPKTGGGIDPNIEAIVALKPDLVLMATSSRGVQRLEGFGLKVVALEPRSAADAQRVMTKLGTLLEVPDAQRIWRAIDAGVSAAAQSLPQRARPLRVYYEVSTGGYAAGPGSFIGETLTRLGVQNIVTPDLGPFPRINPEYVVRANPDLILIGVRNAAGLEQRPGWRNLRALREQRVCIFSTDESDVLVRPGPRMAEAARILARCIEKKGQGA